MGADPFISQVNPRTKHYMSILHYSIVMFSLKTWCPGGIRTRFFLSLGGCDVHAAIDVSASKYYSNCSSMYASCMYVCTYVHIKCKHRYRNLHMYVTDLTWPHMEPEPWPPWTKVIRWPLWTKVIFNRQRVLPSLLTTLSSFRVRTYYIHIETKFQRVELFKMDIFPRCQGNISKEIPARITVQ
jgi:hypothetical protein